MLKPTKVLTTYQRFLQCLAEIVHGDSGLWRYKQSWQREGRSITLFIARNTRLQQCEKRDQHSLACWLASTWYLDVQTHLWQVSSTTLHTYSLASVTIIPSSSSKLDTVPSTLWLLSRRVVTVPRRQSSSKLLPDSDHLSKITREFPNYIIT